MVFGTSDPRRVYQRRIRRKRRFVGRGILALAIVGIIFLVTNKACQAPPDVILTHKEILESDPANIEAYFTLAETYYAKAIKLDKEGKSSDFFKEAINFYQKGLALDKEDKITGENYYHLGMSYFKISKYSSDKNYYSQANLAFNKAIEKGFKNLDIYIYLGHIAFKSGQIDLAIENYQKAKEFDPEDVAVWFNLGWAYKVKGMPNKALSAFRQASKADDLDKNLKLKIHTILAGIYESQDLLEHAKDEYKELLKSNRNSEIAHYHLGSIYRKQGNREMAVQELEQALKINPANKDAQLELAGIEAKK